MASRSLLTVEDLGVDGIVRMLDLADHMAEVNRRPNPKVPALRGKTVCNIFFEDSTRTRLSFETAAKRLSADTMTFAVSQSSLNKGESLRDTIETITAMGVDAFVVRHRSSGAPQMIGAWTQASVINAGDGWHAHPTQALLDAYTVRTALGRASGAGLDGLRMAIVGDVKHSRVARSTIAAMRMLGVHVTVVAPRTLLPPDVGETVRRRRHRPTRRRARRHRRALSPADAAGAHERSAGAEPAGVHRTVRPHRTAGGAAAVAGADHAPRADEPWRGDRRRSLGTSRLGDHPAGHQRHRRSHGGAVRPARLGQRRSNIHGRRLAVSLLITGARVIDPNGERRVDVRVDGTVVGEVAERLDPVDADEVIDAAGLVLAPGFVDLHVHLREPGREEAETIETGSRAAAQGGFTAVVAMPNTDPTQDSVEVVDFVRRQGERAGLCEVLPSGSITIGRAGTQLTPFAELAAAGVRIFTDDGNGVQDPLLMRRALEYADGLGITLAQHCEVERLTAGAVMHEGSCCSRLGLPGWPSIAEELMVHRDIELVRLTGVGMHFLHLSTAKSVELVRAAKADGLAITAEATPHHFSLTDDRLETYDAIYKVNPPLRTADDIAAIRAGIADGTIDAIATDHAPHAPETKEQPLDQAPPGMLGLETALGVSLATLDMALADVIAALSWKPAAIAGVGDRHGRPIEPGEPANLTIFDPDEVWEVVPARLASKSRNTPYLGMALRGRVIHTIFGGTPVVRDGQALR
jgi:dihydroorotase